MLKTKTKKELQEIKYLRLYDDLCELSELLNISYVSSHKQGVYMAMIISIVRMSDQAKQRLIVIML